MSAVPDKPDGAAPPGKGVLGWLGRQVGYVTRAVRHEVPDAVGQPKVFRNTQVEEQTHPHLPNVKLRRTTIDEVMIDPKTDKKPKPTT